MPRERRSQSQDEDVESFIGAGGSAPKEDKDEKEIKPFTVRFPKQLIDEIDKAISNQMVSESRNQWLMDAAAEKLKRETDT